MLSRGDPGTNSICRGLIVLALDGHSPPRLVDEGGSAILVQGDYRGLQVVVGAPAVVRPAWSPDGRLIAYLRRDEGVTQLWVVAASGGRARPLTSGGGDVERFRWSADGGMLIAERRAVGALPRAKLANEALQGFAYDARFVPTRGSTPQPASDQPLTTVAIDLATGAVRDATASERTRIMAVETSDVGIAGDASLPLSPARPWVGVGPGMRVTCRAAECAGAVAAFVDRTPHTILYLRREGWARETVSLYEWRWDRAAAPRRRWSTSQVLLGCVPAARDWLCLAESSRAPRHVVLLDPRSGRARTLFDPNPEFAGIALDRVERLYWRNDRGLEARGDLVLPSGVPPAGGWPMIVTQYHSDGFLRGATGDEYPIFAFAARGYAVLSIEQTPIVALAQPDLKSFEDVNAYNARGWAERRSLLSSLLTGVAQVVRRGAVDPGRIGITGLSDGATTVAFALINSRVFAAAAMSSCCIEPLSAMALGGPGYADHMRRLGYPAAGTDDRSFWAPMSLAQNAARIDTPILMQLADDEYLLGLPSYVALRQSGQPVDLYVFPDEHHVKWQPAHRLAVYQRNIDWFDFWLKRSEDSDPAKADQYRRWRSLRDAQGGKR